MKVLKHNIGELNRKSIWLSEQDIALLKLLGDCKSLSLYQIEYYFERLYGLKRNTIRKKLLRWREKDLVYSKTYTRQPGSRVYYRLRPEGFRALQKVGYAGKDVTNLDEVKRHYDHYFAVRDAILLTYINLRNANKEAASYSPYEIPYYEKGMEGTAPIVVPDWVLTNEYGNIDFEIDTGTETLIKIKEKITKYIKFASQRTDEIHHVLFAVIDDNDPSLKYISEIPKDRNQRIANLKDAIIDLNAHVYPNLNFYVVPISRSGEVAFKILTGAYPLSTSNSFEVNDVTTIMRVYPTLKLDIAPLKAEDFYLTEVQKELYADGHCQFNSPNIQSKETVLIKLMEEGSVRNLDQLSYLDLLQTERRFKKSVDKILAVYSKDEELENDVLGKHFPNIYFSSLEKLIANLKSYPLFYQTLNTARKEEVRLYES